VQHKPILKILKILILKNDLFLKFFQRNIFGVFLMQLLTILGKVVIHTTYSNYSLFHLYIYWAAYNMSVYINRQEC